MVGTIVTVLALRESSSSELESDSSGSSSSSKSSGAAGLSNDLTQGWTLDLVLDDGTVWRGVPATHVQTTDPRTPRGVPPPPVLQRSFTAVTTQKRPVTEGGWEFDKPRERMMDADVLVKAKARLLAACQPNDEEEGDDEEDEGGSSGSGGGIAIPAEDDDKKDKKEGDDDDDVEQEEEKDSASVRTSPEATQYPLPAPFPRLTARLLLRRPRLDGCPGRHALTPFQTPNPSYSCDACGRSDIASGDDMYGYVQ
jgi:hypothetical protein